MGEKKYDADDLMIILLRKNSKKVRNSFGVIKPRIISAYFLYCVVRFIICK